GGAVPGLFGRVAARAGRRGDPGGAGRRLRTAGGGRRAGRPGGRGRRPGQRHGRRGRPAGHRCRLRRRRDDGAPGRAGSSVMAAGGPEASYAPGSWVAIAGPSAWLLAELDPTADPTVTTCWTLLRDGAPVEDVLDALVSVGFP